VITPTKAEIAIWTFEEFILPTKIPVGPGVYNRVKRDINGNGGGTEAMVFQAIEVMGFFILGK
jgi:hypothetical protein